MKERGAGKEKLYPSGEVDPIPDWIFDLIVDPIVKAGILPHRTQVNSAVINDYLPGGCIVSHIDPPQIFDRFDRETNIYVSNTPGPCYVFRVRLSG